jgi:hypothetical protein
MKELKFNEEMQRAINEGRKTQTRRVVDVPNDFYFDGAIKRNDDVYFKFDPSPIKLNKDSVILLIPCPYGRVGAINNGCLIADIRVERLQDISEGDAIKEGVEVKPCGRYKDYLIDGIPYSSPIYSFKSLWQSIYPNHPTKAWGLNPYVWVITFETIEL